MSARCRSCEPTIHFITVSTVIHQHPALRPGAKGRKRMTEWLTVKEAAKQAKCGTRSIYNAVQTGKRRAAKLGGRRELRFLGEWLDDWLLATTTPVMVNSSNSSRTNSSI